VTRLAIALLFGLTTAGPSAAETAARLGAHPNLDASVRLAVRTAQKKLSDAGCQLLYTDFREASGRKLDAVLTAAGRTGAEHFRELVFTVGDGSAACRRGGILAFTSPGNQVVCLCSKDFAEMARRDKETAAAILIHEQLHSLGLLENPPTSREITERVLQRCGR
jgi:hypothetical protein